MVNFVAEPSHDPGLRIAGLDMLASWHDALIIDPVDGRHFSVPAFDLKLLESGLSEEALRTMTRGEDVTVARRAIVMLSRRPFSESNWSEAVRHVLDEKLDETVREEWLGFLRAQDSGKFESVAISCLSANSELLRQSAARQLLDLGQGSAEVGEYLLRTLREFPSAREFQNAMKLLSGVPSPGTVMRGLVENLIAGKVAAPVQLDILEAATKMAGGDEELRRLVAAYHDQMRILGPLAEFDVALEGGNERGGRNLFLNNAQLGCSKCHALKSTDKQVGPSLEGIGKRESNAYLLQSLIDPQAKIVAGYGLVTVQLDDGRSLTGTLVEEDEKELRIKLPDGKIETCAKSSILSQSQPVGVMPDVKTLVNKRQLRDLVAFLKSL